MSWVENQQNTIKKDTCFSYNELINFLQFRKLSENIL